MDYGQTITFVLGAGTLLIVLYIVGISLTVGLSPYYPPLRQTQEGLSPYYHALEAGHRAGLPQLLPALETGISMLVSFLPIVLSPYRFKSVLLPQSIVHTFRNLRYSIFC